MRQMCLLFFMILSILGSLLIALSLSLCLKSSIYHESQETPLDLNWILKLGVWERFSIFAMGLCCFLFLLLDVFFVLWFIDGLRFKRMRSLDTSTYKKYRDDVESQWTEVLKQKSPKLKEKESLEFEYRIETEISPTLNCCAALSMCEIKEIIAREFNLDTTDCIEKLIHVKTIDEREAVAELIFYHGNQENLI